MSVKKEGWSQGIIQAGKHFYCHYCYFIPHMKWDHIYSPQPTIDSRINITQILQQ